MTAHPLTKLAIVAAVPAVWLVASHPVAGRTLALVAGVALVTWGTARLAERRGAAPAPPVRPSGLRPERRIERRPTRRGPRDVRCPAAPTLAQRHAARRPADR